MRALTPLTLALLLGGAGCRDEAPAAPDAQVTPPAPARPVRAPDRARPLRPPALLDAAEVPIWGLSIPVGCRAHAHWKDWQDFRCSASFSAVERFFVQRYPTGRLSREGKGARFDPRVGKTGYVRLQRLRGQPGVRLLVFQGAAVGLR